MPYELTTNSNSMNNSICLRCLQNWLQPNTEKMCDNQKHAFVEIALTFLGKWFLQLQGPFWYAQTLDVESIY